jgi:spore maturation protein A
MNKIWLGMIIIALSVLCFIDAQKVVPAMLEASNKAFSLSLKLCAIYALWLGIFRVLEATGFNVVLSKLLRPVIRFLFGPIPERASEYIALNFSANLLGLGSAATPMGTAAMTALEDGSVYATNAMIMLMVINASSIQLLPTNIISLRQAANSQSPSDIILPSILATVVSLIFSVILVKICCALFIRKRERTDGEPDIKRRKGRRTVLPPPVTISVKESVKGTIEESAKGADKA